jgi:hypothetical protein
MKKLCLLAACILLVACEKDVASVEDLGENASIIGTWVEVPAINTTPGEYITRLERREDLDEHLYGFVLAEDGTFLERKNVGWCGTPPITYGNFEGTWTALSDSLLDIVVDYWGGVMTYQMRIVEVDTDSLSVRYFYSEDRLQAR